MATITATTASSSFPKPSIPRLNYHAFLSFRGEDTRTNFTAHLYAALKRAGIETFKDDDDLKRGDVISDELLKAIEESMFAIVVLSENYTDSSWCLDELQKIVESRKDLSQTVFPVFYKVDPSDIRHQKGGFMESAFEKHKTKFTEEKMQCWRRALTDVSNIAGWDTRDKYEVQIVEDIVKAIWTKLRVKLPSNFDYLVGIQSKVDKLISLLKMELEHKCFIGIWGMGGIGKTTLARVVYEAIQSKFEASCFIANVKKESKRNGLVYLQKELLSRLLQRKIEVTDSYEGVKAIKHFLCSKRILIILDDVSHISQLETLAGNKEWFGSGSKMIITTRDIHLLRAHEQFRGYEIEMLTIDESLQLLYQKAFKNHKFEARYLELSKKVVQYAGGLPLALEVLGRFLCQRRESEWRDTLDKMKQNLHKDILETLRISYDDLEDEEYKTIFLDIACFFNWEEKVQVTQILESRGLHPTIGIEVLIEKSLLCYNKSLESEKEFLYMHDLLQEMGKNIVLQESSHDVSRRSRLWSLKDIDLVLKGNKGTKKIQSIVLKLHQPYDANWHPDCFLKTQNLKLLYLSNVHLSRGLNSLPNALEVLIWDNYSLEALPPIDQLFELVHLQLHCSKIKLWNETQILDRLKVIDLSHSRDLIKMLDFSGTPNLESLLLEGCISLVTLHESLGQLKKLEKLNLKDCKSLIVLPSKFEMDSLKEFILSGCSKLEKLPAFGTNMKSLSIFDVSETNIKKIPSSLVHLTHLKQLSLRGCIGLASNSHSLLPTLSGLSGLLMLRKLDLSFCNMSDGIIPNDLSGLSSLFKLDLRGNNFVSLPSTCISNLLNLEHLNLSGCPRLQTMPQLPPNLYMVDANGCSSMEPLSDLPHLFASLISKHRNLLAYEVVSLCIPGYEIPAWFEHRNYHCKLNGVSLSINIPYIKNKSEWSGIAVCLACYNLWSKSEHFSREFGVYWKFKAPADGDNQYDSLRGCHFGKARYEPHLCIAFFPFNTQNCWRHLRGETRQLELQIEPQRSWIIKECGWCLVCKKDFDVCSTSIATATATASSIQITELGNDNSCCHEFVREGPAVSTSFDHEEEQFSRPSQRSKTT